MNFAISYKPGPAHSAYLYQLYKRWLRGCEGAASGGYTYRRWQAGMSAARERYARGVRRL